MQQKHSAFGAIFMSITTLTALSTVCIPIPFFKILLSWGALPIAARVSFKNTYYAYVVSEAFSSIINFHMCMMPYILMKPTIEAFFTAFNMLSWVWIFDVMFFTGMIVLVAATAFVDALIIKLLIAILPRKIITLNGRLNNVRT